MEANIFPPIVLTDFKIAGKQHKLDKPFGKVKEINLNHDQNIISFNFSALDFISPTNNKYLHRLVGFSDEWLPSNHGQEVTYTNLNAGDYLFEVKGSNSDGLFNPDPLTIRLHINPSPMVVALGKADLLRLRHCDRVICKILL